VIRINLLPLEDRVSSEDPKDRVWLIAGLGAFACTVLVIFSMYAMQGNQIQALAEEAATLETLAAKYKPLIQRVNEIAKERRDLEAKMQVIDELDVERSFRVRLLEDLNSKMPRYAWLTKFSESEGASAEIQGKTFSNLTISDFMSKLESSDLYENVDLTISKKGEIGERDVVEFRVTAALTKAHTDTSAASEHAGAAH
jgi:type IV pilus assembly protein PilN